MWTWEQPSGGQFANINRPIAGATHEQELPVGKHPLQLYSLATPNGQKVSIMLEELLEKGHEDAEYDAWPIRIGEGDQFGSGFVDVNPNSKIPALVDRSGPEPVRVFESGAILVYLAEKFGEFLPASGPERAETLSWLFWQMGSAPFLGGGFGHFFAYAPEKIEYPINRYAMEAKRQLDVLNRRLAEQRIYRRRRTIRSPISRSGRGTAASRSAGPTRAPTFPRDPRIRASDALGEADRRPPRGQARPHRQQAHRRSRPSSSTSATTPAISSCARRTSC